MTMHRLLSATALAGSLVLAPGAFAQTTAPAPCVANDTRPECNDITGQTADPSEGEEILVTGSRIARSDLDSTVPITSVTAADLIDTGDVSLGDAINQLPALRSTFSQANSTRAIGTAGLNILDLRGLGTDRTLVLVNGRRHVSSVPGSYNVDINTIPNALLQSVDVVTGGTSAVYGSDAIAGVVNFQLRTDYEGTEMRLQGGVSERGDRGSYIASVVSGKNFNEGRGNVAVSLEYARSDTLLFQDRNDQTGAYTGVPGFNQVEVTSRLPFVGATALVNEPPQGNGVPDTRFIDAYPGRTFGNLSLGGAVQTQCVQAAQATTPLLIARRNAICSGVISPTTLLELPYNYYFLDNGVLTRDAPGQDLRAVQGGLLGGYSATGVEGAMLSPGLERINTNLLFNYEFSPALRFFFEGKYVRSINNQTSTQPTFVNSTLSPTFFLDNPFLTDQNRATIQTLLGVPSTNTTASFTFFRFNNDIGTRAEDHKRETYRFVGGFRGDLGTESNLRYDVAFNYGRTNTYYETGGNVNIARFNAAANAVRNSAGQIVCRVNADTNPNNDLPGCVPLNLFGQYRASQEALNYVLYTSSREQWAEEINAVASISGDLGSLFTLPAGDIGFALGAEYRKEDAFSDYDDFTQSGATFLNSISAFDPPAVDVYEGFGEVRIPILRDMLVKELTFEGAARYSKYSTSDDGVWAWNVGGIFAPFDGLRIRAGYARSVRAPNLSDLYATASQTFANGLVDPCNQGATILANPNRVRNCAAAGVPTTITYTDDLGTVRTLPFVNTPASGIVGINSGNINLRPEVGKSFTVGAVFEPTFLRGFTLAVDYYNIEVTDVISGLSGQGIINQCYDDPVGIDNPYCAVVFRRTSTNSVVNGTFAGQQNRQLAGVGDNGRDFAGVPITNSFINQPFNYAKLKTSGIDADIRYNHTFDNGLRFSYRTLVSWLAKRESFFFITDPTRSTRIHGTLGDPIWKGRMSVGVAYKGFDAGYDLNYIGRMAVDAWEVQHTHQGRGPTNYDAYPIRKYAAQDTHDIQLGYRVNEQFRFYFGVDNVMDTLPPYGLTGTGAGSGIYGLVGRYFYSGVNLKF